MAFFDYPLDTLRAYKPDVAEPAGFDSFWHETLIQNPAVSEPLERHYTAQHLKHLVVEDLAISGYGGTPVRAWFIRPREVEGPLPIVVSFIGYGGEEDFLRSTSTGQVPALPNSLSTRGARARNGAAAETPLISPRSSPPCRGR